ncbi:MAG: toll/interleukin-1 receptor domain-containing protein [Thermodesulfobacteriota bacterium]
MPATNKNKGIVCLSFTRRNKNYADKIKRYLLKSGFAIADMINSANYFVPLITDDYSISGDAGYVLKLALSEAEAGKLKIIPLKIEHGGIPPKLKTRDLINFIGNFDAGLVLLEKALTK